LVSELRSAYPNLLITWNSNGSIASVVGIKRAIGDTLGGHKLCWRKLTDTVFQAPDGVLVKLKDGIN
jgi:hypothetical protein